MPRPSSNLQKHTVRLYAGEFERLGALFPKQDTNLTLRNILHEFIKKCEGGEMPTLPEVDASDITL